MGFLAWIKGFFSRVFKAFMSFSEDVAKIAVKEGAACILDVTRKAVRELAKTNLSNTERRNEALSRISKYAESRGLDVPERIKRKVLEDCVIEYKAEF